MRDFGPHSAAAPVRLPAGPPVSRTSRRDRRGQASWPASRPASWPAAARAELFTATLILLGSACAPIAWLAFEGRLAGGRLPARDQILALAALAAGAEVGLLLGLGLGLGRGLSVVVRPTTLAYLSCILLAGATTTFGVIAGPEADLARALGPGCVAAFGAGALVPAALCVAGRRKAAMAGAVAVVVAAVVLAVPLLDPTGSPSTWAPLTDADGRPYYTTLTLVSTPAPDGDRILSDQTRLLLFGILTCVAATAGLVERAYGAWSTARSSRRARVARVTNPSRPETDIMAGASGPDEGSSTPTAMASPTAIASPAARLPVTANSEIPSRPAVP